MIQEIDVSQIISNPFNPKNPFDKDEEKILNKSLEKWGLRGCFLVCKDYNNPAQYIVIDGNTRYKKQKGLVKVDIIDNINNDDDLQQITLDFCSAVKKHNYSALNRLYSFQKNRLSDEYKNVFEKLKVNIQEKRNDIQQNTSFNKFVVLKFENEIAFIQYQEIIGNLKRKIKENDKLFKEIEQIDIDNNSDLIQKYFMEIIMRLKGEIKR